MVHGAAHGQGGGPNGRVGTAAERQLFLEGCGETCKEQSEKENAAFLSNRKIKGGAAPAPTPAKRQMTLGFAVAKKKIRE